MGIRWDGNWEYLCTNHNNTIEEGAFKNRIADYCDECKCKHILKFTAVYGNTRIVRVFGYIPNSTNLWSLLDIIKRDEDMEDIELDGVQYNSIEEVQVALMVLP